MSGDAYEQSLHRIYKAEIDAMRAQREVLLDHLRIAEQRIDDLERELVGVHELLADEKIAHKDTLGREEMWRTRAEHRQERLERRTDERREVTSLGYIKGGRRSRDHDWKSEARRP